MNNKKIGIWGFGRVGKSVAQLLGTENCVLSIMTQDTPTENEIAWIQDNGIQLHTQEEKEFFFAHNDYIIPSPGIDIRPYYHLYTNRWLTEVDLFYARFKKPIIAITGTVGKTSTTFLLDQILGKYGLNICTGGNIGTPMCDLMTQQEGVGYGLLEISSFQLEYAKQCAPYLTLWTNLAPNHLDRHATYDDYFNAKYNSIAHQNSSDKAIVPLYLAEKIKSRSPKSAIYYLNYTTPTQKELSILNNNDILFFIDNNHIKKKVGASVITLMSLDTLPEITFAQNWLTICSALDILGLPLEKLPAYTHMLTIPEHRMEKITAHDIVFYNDSKSTTTTSTNAALAQLSDKSIILFIGGLSKGVDRANFIKELKNKVKYVYCFGAEAEILNTYCVRYGITSRAFSTLDAAFDICMQTVTEQDCVLFSPAGSSYDLFKNYEDRGSYFKQLVRNFSDSNITT